VGTPIITKMASVLQVMMTQSKIKKQLEFQAMTHETNNFRPKAILQR